MIFSLTAKKLIGHDVQTSSEKLRENFDAFINGLISFPLDIPGTAYHECLQVHPETSPSVACNWLQKVIGVRKLVTLHLLISNRPPTLDGGSLWPQGRKRAMKMLKNISQERRTKPRKQNQDFFDYVLEELSKEGTILTGAIALDLTFVLLFASFETTSLAITLAVKYLTDYPLILQTLTVIIFSFIHLVICSFR